MDGLYSHTDSAQESSDSLPSSTLRHKTCATSKAPTTAPVSNQLTPGPGELNTTPTVSQSSASGIIAVAGDSCSQPTSIPTNQNCSAKSRPDRSPMSQACESSIMPGCHPVGYINRGEMFTEHPLCPGPPEHASHNFNGKDKSFVGVVSAINAMNLSMNTSRLSSIDLASSLETYAAVIHSRTNSSAEADKNEACANCFDHAAVFWMEWAAIQAKLQVSLIEDLYKLKDLASSIESGCNSIADTIDVDSIRAVAVKLTKTSHESFKEAYEKGSGWSSVGGLDYWAKKLPEPVIKDAPTIYTRPENSTQPPAIFGTADVLAVTKIDRQFTLKKDNHHDHPNKHSNKSFDYQQLDTIKNSSSTRCSFKDHQDIPELRRDMVEVDKTDGVVRRTNERCVHSFKYPNGRIDEGALPPLNNEGPILSRSAGVMNFDTIYSNAIEKSNNKLQAVADLNTISEETDSEDDEIFLNKNSHRNIIEDQDAGRGGSARSTSIIQDTSINFNSNHQKNIRIEQKSEASNIHNDNQQDNGKWVQGNVAEEETNNNCDSAPSSYLFRPLSYAITEEGSVISTPPKKQIYPGAATRNEASHKSDIPTGVSRPSNIRRKGKFHKENGSILMLSKRVVDDSSSEDDAAKENLNPKSGRINRSKEPGKNPISTINGGQNLVPPKLQHIEIPFFDRGPTAIAQPLEPNYNYPDQYPSRGYFSEDLSEQNEVLTLEATKSLPENTNQNAPGWANRFKKIIKFPRANEQTSLMSPPSLKRQLSPDPEYPMSPSAKQKKLNSLS